MENFKNTFLSGFNELGRVLEDLHRVIPKNVLIGVACGLIFLIIIIVCAFKKKW